MPVCCWICRHRLCALILAEARGESGTLMAWMPVAASARAPSTSFVQSMPRGGTISTMVMNSPAATSLPIFERSASGAGGVSPSVTAGARAGRAALCASIARMADFMARM